jgi:GNAT superfamily N-acetyltransferase
MDLTIRKAGSNDFSAICKLIQNELGYKDLNINEAIKRLEFFQNSVDRETFVAADDDKIIGFTGVMKDVSYVYDGYYSQIMALAVLEKFQGLGIGTKTNKTSRNMV